MSAAVKYVLIAAAIALGLGASAYTHSYASPIHHYRHRQAVQRDFGVGTYHRREPYNYSTPYNFDPGYPASDTAAALDE